MPAAARPRLARRLLAGLVLVVGLVAAGSWTSVASATTATPGAPAQCSTAALSKQEAVDQLHDVRISIDKTLRLLDAGDREAAFAEAKSGYLTCFESVEAPLDVVAGAAFRFKVEDIFARVRGLIDSGAPTGEVRDRIVELRGLIDSGAPNSEVRDRIVELRGLVDESERQLTEKGVGAPLLVFGQAGQCLVHPGEVGGPVIALGQAHAG